MVFMGLHGLHEPILAKMISSYCNHKTIRLFTKERIISRKRVGDIEDTGTFYLVRIKIDMIGIHVYVHTNQPIR